MVEFSVPTIPVAQPRQRQTVAFVGGKPRARNFTPTNAPVNAYKAAVQMAFREACKSPPLVGPLRVDLVFVFPRPRAKIWKTKPMPRENHTAKPDLDNLAKATLDALNALAFIDDSQVAELTIKKWIASGDETAHVEIKITELA